MKNVLSNDIDAKKLKFSSIYFMGINVIVGSGIFLLPQNMYKDMGVFSIFALIIAAITIGIIALCYADLASRFTKSGAAWLYTYNAYGRFAGFQVGVFTWFLGICTIAAETAAILRVLKNIFPIFQQEIPYYIFAFSLIIVLAIINLFGMQIIKLVNNISSITKLLAIAVFIIVGVFFLKFNNFIPLLPKNITNSNEFISAFGLTFSITFYMFTGFSFVPIAASKMENPQKNVPKALIFVMISTTILYVLTFGISIGILGDNMAIYDIPIAAAFRSVIGDIGYYLMIIAMLLAIFSVCFVVSFNTPILAASLAKEENLLPSFIAKENRFQSPYIAILITTIGSLILVFNSYVFLVTCIVLASFIQYIMVILSVIKFKHNKKFPNQGFNLKGGYLVPILGLLISLYLLFSIDIQVIIVGVIVFILGIILYLINKRENASALNTKN